MSNYEEFVIGIVRAMTSPENESQCEDIARELKLSGLFSPENLSLEFGVEYTGMDHGGRHVEWCNQDTPAESLGIARWNASSKALSRKNPKIVYRLVSIKEYLEV